MFRIGFGFDSHRFAPGKPLILGGLEIQHTMGVLAHSDGDVVLHALTDAILGAIAAGDIGEHFPDSDPRWAKAESSQFVRHAVKLAKEAGYVTENCDITILAETPKLSPHKQAMADRIAKLLNVDLTAVSIKAKTTEGMGLIGAGEGIACYAIVLLKKICRE